MRPPRVRTLTLTLLLLVAAYYSIYSGTSPQWLVDRRGWRETAASFNVSSHLPPHPQHAGVNSNTTKHQHIGLNLNQTDSDSECRLDKFQLDNYYPHCLEKIGWLSLVWKMDPCYTRHGVNGSLCSFILYMSEVEKHCPLLPSRQSTEHMRHTDMLGRQQARVETSISGLLSLMTVDADNFSWMKSRMRSMWSAWLEASPVIREYRRVRYRKTIWLHMGVLSRDVGFGKTAGKGGPLGELVQWTDLISTLYILGHRLLLTTQPEMIKPLVRRLEGERRAPGVRSSSCSSGAVPPLVDIIYVDITGWHQIRRVLGNQAAEPLKCLLRVVDSFGTEPWFNHERYAATHNVHSGWGKLNLDPQQFNTMFPHTDDNSFLGFVVHVDDADADVDVMPMSDADVDVTPSDADADVDVTPSDADADVDVTPSDADAHVDVTPNDGQSVTRNISLIYGKQLSLWQGHSEYLRLVSQLSELHATVVDDVTGHTKGSHAGGSHTGHTDMPDVPPYVHNHGMLSGERFRALLRRTKLFIGLGLPFEGPAPLEAIAHGCIFINPALVPPRNRENEKGYSGKPTYRYITSQNPYAETYIGEPYVYTVDINNLTEARRVLSTALTKQIPPYIPVEYTMRGMMQRVLLHTEKQDFCVAPSERLWPPHVGVLSAILAHTTALSCTDVCRKHGLVCERSFFHRINTTEAFLKWAGVRCHHVSVSEDVYFPALTSSPGVQDSGPPGTRCHLQGSDHLLFSCAGAHSHYQRLCPCRDYMRGQVALCPHCLQ